MKKLIYISLIAVLFISCVEEKSTKLVADKIITNAKVYTVNEEQPWAEAVAIKDNEIVFVGSSADAKEYIGENSNVIDANGQLLLPGFIETHFHLLVGAATNSGLVLDQGDGIEEIVEKLAVYAEENSNGKTIFAGGLNTALIANGTLNKSYLDAVVSDRAVVILDNTGHNVWANSEALKQAGIGKDTPDVPNGTYIRDDRGETTGVIAGTLAHIPVINDANAITAESIASALPETTDLLREYGFTSVMEMGMPIATEAAYQSIIDLDNKGEMPVRVSLAYYFNSPELAEQVINTIDEFSERYKSEHVWLNTAKILGDGIIENRKAAMMEPYDDVDSSGALTVSEELITEKTLQLAEMGYNTTIHVVGDRAIHVALNAAEALRTEGYDDIIFSTTHSWFVQPDDVPRYAKFNVIAQTTGVWVWKKDFYPPAVGQKRNDELQFPLRSWADNNVDIALGSDYPATDGGSKGVSPFNNIYGVMKRQIVPELRETVGALEGALKPVNEVLTIEEAIKAYTISGAKMLGKQNEIGTIEVGKKADLVLLSQNLLEISVDDIPSTKVLFTMMDGEYTYQAK